VLTWGEWEWGLGENLRRRTAMTAIKTVVIPNKKGDIPKIFAAIHLTSLQLSRSLQEEEERRALFRALKFALSFTLLFFIIIIIKKKEKKKGGGGDLLIVHVCR
jgi:hypothetical protein